MKRSYRDTLDPQVMSNVDFMKTYSRVSYRYEEFSLEFGRDYSSSSLTVRGINKREQKVAKRMHKVNGVFVGHS